MDPRLFCLWHLSISFPALRGYALLAETRRRKVLAVWHFYSIYGVKVNIFDKYVPELNSFWCLCRRPCNMARQILPMWRNGRRNGLKIRSCEKRGMGSNPIKGDLTREISQTDQIFGCAGFRSRDHENEAYLPSIRQVRCRLRKSTTEG